MNFIEGPWTEQINVTDFVKRNITPYEGDASFLVGPTERTRKLWNICLQALEEERANGGVRSLDPDTVSTISSHKAGYIDKENELIVGLQTDELLKRAIKPFGGIKVVEKACAQQGHPVNEHVKDIFTHYRKTHNDGVFDVYTEEIRRFRSLGFLTGLPDNYARGRIIGDYRRLAVYGIDRLIEAKEADKKAIGSPMTDERIRLREEVAEQIKALKEMKVMGEYYGLDLGRPAQNAQEAVQWVYMAYLAAVKEQDGAAMSLGNVSSFLDIYIEHDLKHNLIDETFAQELIDQFDLSKCSKSGAKFDYIKGQWFNREYILKTDDAVLAPAFDQILKANGIDAPIERVQAVVGMMKMKKINFIKELWPLCDFFFIAPTYSADDKFTRKNWKEGAAADMEALYHLLEGLDDFSIESQKAVVDAWAAETGKKPWNPWRVCLVGTGKGPDMYELAAFLGKEETLRRMKAAIEALH